MSAQGVVIQVDGYYEGLSMIAMLETGGLVGTYADGKVTIDHDGLHGSDPEDVLFELSEYGVDAEVVDL